MVHRKAHRLASAWMLALICCAISPSFAGVENSSVCLRRWLLCGAFLGIGGIASNGHRIEAHLMPAQGDTVELSALDRILRATWKPYTSPTDWIDLEAEGAFKEHPDFSYPRGCAYACVYLRARKPLTVRLRIATSIGYAIAWWDTERIGTSSLVTITPQWHRLLLKLVHPRVNERGFGERWLFKVKLEAQQGASLDDLETCLNDPTRAREERMVGKAPLGERIRVRLKPSQPAFTFLPDEPIAFSVQMALTEGEEESLTVEWRATDFDDREVGSGSSTIRLTKGKPASVRINLGTKPVGFYNVWLEIQRVDGIVKRLKPIGCAVIRGSPKRNNVHRKLSSAFYWLQPNDYIRWLSRVGFARNVGMQATWWTKSPESDEFKPIIDELVRLAERWNVELVGYLDGGWPPAMNPKLNLKPKQLFIWAWTPLPEYDSPEYERIVRRYVRRVVSRYRRSIRIWKSYNEVDLTPMPPELYARIATLIAEELKKADPQAKFIGASFSKPPEQYWRKVVQAGGVDAHDAIDLHTYPLFPPRFSTPCNLSGWKVNGATYNAEVVRVGRKPLPIWWGEVGARRSLSPDGATGQADFFLKMCAVAFADPQVKVIAWCDPMAEHGDDSTLIHKGWGASPAVCSANVAAWFLDGRRATILRNDDVQAAVFADEVGETLAIWSFSKRRVRLKVEGDVAQVIDVVGRVKDVPIHNGMIELTIDRTIQLVRAKTVRMIR